MLADEQRADPSLCSLPGVLEPRIVPLFKHVTSSVIDRLGKQNLPMMQYIHVTLSFLRVTAPEVQKNEPWGGEGTLPFATQLSSLTITAHTHFFTVCHQQLPLTHHRQTPLHPHQQPNSLPSLYLHRPIDILTFLFFTLPPSLFDFHSNEQDQRSLFTSPPWPAPQKLFQRLLKWETILSSTRLAEDPLQPCTKVTIG